MSFFFNRGHLARNIKFREKSDRVIVKLLHEAQNHIESMENDKAYEILQEAQRLAPDYFEVARMKAYFYQKNGNYADAREQYELAILLSPDSPQLHYWYGKFLLNQDDNLNDAVVQFEKANLMDNESTEVALALSRGYLYQHEFSKAQKLLDELEQKIMNADEHLVKMYYDTAIQIDYHTADDLAKIGECEQALVSLEAMRKKFYSLEIKFKDRHIRKKLSKCNYTLNKMASKASPNLLNKVSEMQKWISIESVS